MHKVSKLNQFALLGVSLVAIAMAFYVAAQPKIKADAVSCSTDCAYIKVKLDGVRFSNDGSWLAAVMVQDPSGKTLAPGSSGSTGSKTYLYFNNVFDNTFVAGTEKIGPFAPGSGYKVIVSDLNPQYKLTDSSKATQTANLSAGQTTEVNYPLTYAGGGKLSALVNFTGGKKLPTSGQFGDLVLDCDGQVTTAAANFSSDSNASSLANTTFTMPGGRCSLEIKNYDSSKYKLVSGTGGTTSNPKLFDSSNRDSSIYFTFEVIASTIETSNTGSQGSGATAASPSPGIAAKTTPSPKTKTSPNSKAVTAANSATPIVTADSTSTPAVETTPSSTPDQNLVASQKSRSTTAIIVSIISLLAVAGAAFGFKHYNKKLK